LTFLAYLNFKQTLKALIYFKSSKGLDQLSPHKNNSPDHQVILHFPKQLPY